MAKNIQIPEALFVRLCRFHLFGVNEEAEAIKQGLDDKLEAIIRRDLYGKAVRGDEDARKEYLDRVGISEDFRW